MIGQTISHYKILEKLGEGGMGVVYKAEDTKLKRTVALKFLPKGLEAHEPERARFLQEAQAASALNHTNVCTIYDIKEEADQHFIVMEYVDGKTLRQLIPIQKMQDAITYAIQIGEALQEAHSHGVIHRDVKPENIMVNTKNQIKVMDFGLAKLKGSLKLTRTSSTVGTLAYMAPEQIQGGEVDARSDIFSFGIVLFEMLTGRLPFRGEHDAAMVYSIVNEEAAPIERYKPDVSPLLTNIIQRTLEKDPNDRYLSANDMVIELRRVQKKTTKISRGLTTQISTTTSREGITPEREISKKPFKKMIWAGVSTVVLLVIIAVVYLILPKHGLPVALNPDMTFRVLPISFTEVLRTALSQDGNWAAFSATDLNNKWDVYFMNTTSGESRRITSDSSGVTTMGLGISPDGSQVVYSRYKGARDRLEIAIAPSLGGLSKKILERGSDPRWRPDGKRIGYLLEKQIGSQTGKAEFWTMKPDGSDNRCELVDSVSTFAEGFCWAPDGQSICWIRYFDDQYTDLAIYKLSSREMHQITFDKKDIGNVCWAPNGQILFSSNRNGNSNIWMVPASGGTPTQITKGVGPDNMIGISRDCSKLLYRQSQLIGHIWIAGMDGGTSHQITFDAARVDLIGFSPDGKEVLFEIRSKEGTHLYSIDRDGQNRKQVTQLASITETNSSPRISPDGRWIVYGRYSLSNSEDSSVVFLIDAKSPGIPKPVGKGVPIRWLDEKTFACFINSKLSTWIYDIEGGEPQKFFEDSTWAIPLQGKRYVFYADYRRSGELSNWISSAPGVKDPSLPSPQRLPSWLNIFDKSGKYCYGVKNAGELRRISLPSGKEEVIRGVFPGLNSTFSMFDISYDGKEIVYTDTRISGKLIMIENPFK